ncbi:MAG TPA: hypothetical protein VGM19_03310 [Armatimonadota bacterium]|jgi:plastocyanin
MNAVSGKLLFVLTAVVAASLVLGLTGCGSGGDSFAGAIIGVNMTALDSFDPVNVTVNRGDMIRWTNQDTDPHTATADLANPTPGGPNSAFQFPAGLPTHATYSFIVPNNTPHGTVWFYHCCNHGMAGNGTSLGLGMSGSITVN